jgi:hypothetical protein
LPPLVAGLPRDLAATDIGTQQIGRNLSWAA